MGDNTTRTSIKINFFIGVCILVSMVDFNISGLIKTETIKLLKLIYKILPCKKNSIFFTQKNAIHALQVFEIPGDLRMMNIIYF